MRNGMPCPDRGEILRYLGCSEESAPEELVQAVEQGCEEIRRTARPRHVWRCFPLEGRQVARTALYLEGEDILRHLEGCSQVVLMAATLGAEVERLLMRTGVLDMSRALVLDACASGMIEAVCDALEAELRQRWRPQGLYLTGRFSPGYGDFPLSVQETVCQLLDTQRRMGLTLSPSGLMIPRKSVTALLGLSPTPLSRRSGGCTHCNMYERCLLRKGGKTCD